VIIKILVLLIVYTIYIICLIKLLTYAAVKNGNTKKTNTKIRKPTKTSKRRKSWLRITI